MRTLTVRKGGGKGNFSAGWHVLTISGARYGSGEFDGKTKKHIDVHFKDYPENFNLRVYEQTNKDGEEWAIGQLFRFANAGISDAMEGPENMVIKFDDSSDCLVGKQINVFFHKDGEYYRALKQIAPVVFENAVEAFNENDVEYWKSRAETYYTDYVQNKTNGTTVTNGSHTGTPTLTTSGEELPF